jgi:hypothetical protein
LAYKEGDFEFVRVLLQSHSVVSSLQVEDLETAYIHVHAMASSKERDTAHELIKHFLSSELELSSESWDLILLDSIKTRLYDVVSDLILSDKSKDAISSRGYRKAFDHFTRDLDATQAQVPMEFFYKLISDEMWPTVSMKLDSVDWHEVILTVAQKPDGVAHSVYMMGQKSFWQSVSYPELTNIVVRQCLSQISDARGGNVQILEKLTRVMLREDMMDTVTMAHWELLTRMLRHYGLQESFDKVQINIPHIKEFRIYEPATNGALQYSSNNFWSSNRKPNRGPSAPRAIPVARNSFRALPQRMQPPRPNAAGLVAQVGHFRF